MLKYPAIIHNDPDGLWVEFPDLQGCLTQGETMDELLYMAKDAMSAMLSVMLDEGDEIPEPSRLKGENSIYIDVPLEIEIPIMLKKYRKSKGLTQGNIAENLKVTYQNIQKLEKSKSNPTIKTLKKIADVLGLKLEVNLIPKKIT